MATWKGKTRGGKFGYLFFIYLIRYAGINAAYTFLYLVVPYFIPFAPKATRSIWLYSRDILGISRLASVKMLFRNYYRLGQILIDKVATGAGMTDKFNFKFELYNEFLDILNGDKGVVMISAHIGNWELGAPFFDEYGKKMNVVMYDAEYEKIKEVLARNTSAGDYKIIPVNRDNLTHVFEIKNALDQKEYVCFQGDRYLNKENLLSCNFLGREAFFPAGPFLIASRMRVQVVFYFAMREPSRTYRFYFEPVKTDLRRKDKKPEQVLLEEYAGALEKMVKAYPEQWFNYYPFWKDFEN